MKRMGEERGSTTLQWAILFPVPLIVLFGAVQAGLWFHHTNIALTAAQEGARAAAAYQADTSAGDSAAISFATRSGATNPRAATTRSANVVVVTVTVTTPRILGSLLPLPPSIQQTASAPIERIT